MFYYNNWLQYSFDGVLNDKKQTPQSSMNLHFNKCYVSSLNVKDALYHNAMMLEAYYSPPYDILLSGGIDSEIIVRVNHDLGIQQNVYTFRYEDDLNVRDVEAAKTLCNELGIQINIIDFNMKHFIENDAYDLYHKTYFPKIDYLTKIKWLEFLNHTPVFGNGEPYWKKISKNTVEEWMLDLLEHEFSMGLCGRYTDTSIVVEWDLFTPDIHMTYVNEPIIKKLINNKILGKTSSWSSRYELFRNIWPTVRDNIKLVGFEGKFGAAGSCPPYILEFKNKVLKPTSNANFLFTVNDLNKFTTKL